MTCHATELDDQVAHRGKAICRIFLERLLDSCPQWRRDRLRQRILDAVNNRVQDIDVRRARERSPPGERFIQRDTERENIAASIKRLPDCLLRRQRYTAGTEQILDVPRIQAMMGGTT